MVSGSYGNFWKLVWLKYSSNEIQLRKFVSMTKSSRQLTLIILGTAAAAVGLGGRGLNWGGDTSNHYTKTNRCQTKPQNTGQKLQVVMVSDKNANFCPKHVIPKKNEGLA